MFIQQVMNGLTIGGVYALVAIGYTLVYGVLGMINFAHGSIYSLGAYFAWTAVARLGQVVCFGGACLIPVLVCRRFAALELSEGDLLIGVLVTMSMALLCTALGVLLEPRTNAARAESQQGRAPDENDSAGRT